MCNVIIVVTIALMSAALAAVVAVLVGIAILVALSERDPPPWGGDGMRG